MTREDDTDKQIGYIKRTGKVRRPTYKRPSDEPW